MRNGYQRDLEKAKERMDLIQKELEEVNALIEKVLEESALTPEPEKKMVEVEQKMIAKEQKPVRL